MTPRQVELVQQTWKQVEPIADTAARLFYRRLFEIAPEVRPLFKTSVSEQGDKLMKSLAVVVNQERFGFLPQPLDKVAVVDIF